MSGNDLPERPFVALWTGHLSVCDVGYQDDGWRLATWRDWSGMYLVKELPAGTGDSLVSWMPTTALRVEVTVESTLFDNELSGTVEVATFGNVCVGTADFGSKGYWHNKNGLSEIADGDITYVNGLLPYSQASSDVDDGDEPFDGKFENGDDVASALGGEGELIAPAGSSLAEISQFLIDPNAGGDPREQLAQQLLAFIFDRRHRLHSQSSVIELPNEDLVSALHLIDEAILDWASGTAIEQDSMKSLLDAMNNKDHVTDLLCDPCAVVA
ncbi:MAG: hypothetical protein ABGZ17_25930 [Planctomycetaceae bacterium]